MRTSGEDMPDMNKSRRHVISRRVRVSAAVITVALIAIERAARATRGSHNRRASHLGQRLHATVRGPALRWFFCTDSEDRDGIGSRTFAASQRIMK